MRHRGKETGLHVEGWHREQSVCVGGDTIGSPLGLNSEFMGSHQVSEFI